MKKEIAQKFVFFFFSLLITCSIYAQKPLITIFSADGYKFKVTMDGKEMNAEYSSRVEYMEMDHDYAKVMIKFEAEDLPNIEKTVQGLDADGKPSSVSYEIKKNNKGTWKLAVSSWKPLEEAKKEKVGSSYYSEPAREPATEIYEQPATSTTIVTTETITTETTSPTDGRVGINSESASFNMNIAINDGIDNTSVGINVGVPGVSMTETQSQTSYTTVTNTSTTSTNEIFNQQPTSDDVQSSGYINSGNCSDPMSDDRFLNVKNSISSKDFEDSKLTVAKQVIKSNCLYVSQVKEIMELFDFEDTRLEFAKEAYESTYDISNYYELNDAFEYEMTIEELSEYINNQ